MSNYTKTERHEIYKKAKELFLSNSDSWRGMCKYIQEALVQRHMYSYSYNSHDLPEFFSLKTTPEREDGYWWNPYDAGVRLKNFDLIIEQTK